MATARNPNPVIRWAYTESGSTAAARDRGMTHTRPMVKHGVRTHLHAELAADALARSVIEAITPPSLRMSVPVR